MTTSTFGHFSPTGDAYHITDPEAPRPWANIISNGRYGLAISHNGGGFSWLDHCQLNVITRWDMDLVRDDHGRCIYLTDLDEENTPVWSLAPQPTRPDYDHYECTHRPGSTTFDTSLHGIDAKWTIAVASVDTAELWHVTLTNTSDRPRRLRLGSFFEWCCGEAPDTKREFHRLFFNTEYVQESQAIVATKNMWTAAFGDNYDHWNRPWPYTAAFAIAGLNGEPTLRTSDKEAFFGRYGAAARPQAMTRADNNQTPQRFGRFVDASAALGGDLTLEPGQTQTLSFTLAIGSDRPEALGLCDKYSNPARVEREIHAAQEAWTNRLSATTVKTEAVDVNNLNSTWLPYQAISGRLWGRTGYYQQSGAFGFRDQLQDSQVWLPLEPERCAEQIMLHAAHQFTDGTVYHWWNPITETGNHTACSDDYLWLPFIAASYIRETGDLTILDRTAPFVDDPTPATLRDHCERSIARSFARFGKHGLPLIGDMDWNDGLSAIGHEDSGESVWLAQFLCQVLERWAEVCERVGDPHRASSLIAERARLISTINAVAWDGEWFRRAIDKDDSWLGSQDCQAGQIFLNTQTWAILGDLADKQRLDTAWNSVRDRLLTDYGPLLLAPAYQIPDSQVGYITRYAPGSRENGGVYMHAATWALAAACKQRDVEAVTKIWASISPPRRSADAERYAAEPYVLPGNVDGPLSESPGRAGWTWYTGSAAWLQRITLEWVLGIRPVWEGLRIDPCPPPELGKVSVTRLYRGRNLTITFDARAFKPSGVPEVSIDGRRIVGGVLKQSDLPPVGGSATITVVWTAQEFIEPRPEKDPSGAAAPSETTG